MLNPIIDGEERNRSCTVVRESNETVIFSLGSSDLDLNFSFVYGTLYTIIVLPTGNYVSKYRR